MNLIDPLTISEKLSSEIVRDSSCLYADFSCCHYSFLRVSMSQGYSVGCNLNCIFCFSKTKDLLTSSKRYLPPDEHNLLKKNIRFYTPEEAVQIMIANAKTKYVSTLLGKYEAPPRNGEINLLTIGGNEPTVAFKHLIEILNKISGSPYLFYLQTNGILLSAYPEYIHALKRYKDHVVIGVSFKAAAEEKFEKITRASRKFFEYPFRAIELLVKEGMNYEVIIMSDPMFMTSDEKKALIEKVRGYGYKGRIVEERFVRAYPALIRLKEANGRRL